MFKKIQHWIFEDDSELGRPKLSGIQKSNALAVPMITLFLIDQFLTMDSTPDCFNVHEIVNWCFQNILKHLQRDKTVILENVSADGKEMPGSAGRLMNPGHAIEGGWILISIANRLGKEFDWIKSIALENFIVQPFNRGWDNEFGGIFYFLDADNYSPTQLEWNMKLWYIFKFYILKGI
jgi:N-acylglucosamine 2-epimerase